MVDASMVAVPRPSNSREKNKSIKNELSHFGDQNQIEIGVKHKLIRRDEVSPASVHGHYAWPKLRAEKTAARMGELTRLMVDRSASKRDPLKENSYRDKKLISSLGKLAVEWSPSSESSDGGRQLEDRKQRPSQGQR